MVGLIHVYFGEGKGKTTAATGLAVRMAGTGGRVLVLQFLKSRPSGEVTILQGLPNVDVVRGKETKKFSWDMSDEEKAATRAAHAAMLRDVLSRVEQDGCDLLVLDEALGAIHTGLLEESIILDLMRTKPPELELVLTGRDPSEKLLALADYATEMRLVKHPYHNGIAARKGVEF